MKLRTHIVASRVTALGLLVSVAGCGSEGEDPSATVRALQEGTGASAPSEAPIVVASLAWEVPSTWSYREPAGGVRAAEFVIASEGGTAELVFFHFGPGQGGDAEANLMRWARVMVDAAGEPVEPSIEVLDVGGVRTVSALYRGTYLSGAPAGEKTPLTDHALLGAVVEGGPQGSVFLRLTGPEPVVTALAPAWREMLLSVRRPGG